MAAWQASQHHVCSESPYCKCNCYPIVTNGTRADVLISHRTESRRKKREVCAVANGVWLCGVRLKEDELSVILMPSAWPHYWAYCRIKSRMMFTHGSSHSLAFTWKRLLLKALGAGNVWHLSSSHAEFIPVSALTKASQAENILLFSPPWLCAYL